MSDLVKPLNEANGRTLVGGKAQALGEMLRARFNVPAGFVVTTKTGSVMTDALKIEILNRFDALKSSLVAVRSSATSEDGKNAAWAGQFDSFLNVDREHLLESIQKCWQSAESDRAKAYATGKNLHRGPMAVIVQRMVPADVSGVAFSIHPVTKNNRHLVVEAVESLGDHLVSGKTTPDNYVVDKETYKTIEKNLSSEKPLLDEPRISELAKTVSKLEEFFGFPVDVEWSFMGSELFILQSRPITTLK